MSSVNYPSDLPYFDALHDSSLLSKDIAALSIAKDLAKLRFSEIKQKEALPGQAFVDALHETNNYIRTTNGALALKSSRSNCVDLDFQLGNEGGSSEFYFSLLTNAWCEDDLCTLRQIFRTRSIHQGKSAKLRSYLAYGWLLEHHPQTALKNLHLLVTGTIEENRKPKREQSAKDADWEIVEEKKRFKSHGYWKDLLNLLQIYVGGELLNPKLPNLGYESLNHPRMPCTKSRHEKRAHKEKIKNYLIKLRTLDSKEAARRREQRAREVQDRIETEIQEAHEKRVISRKKRHAKVVSLLNKDPKYRALHFTVARLFAEQLKADRSQLEKNRLKQSNFRYALSEGLSLAAKWAPSLYKAHDKQTLIATSIAEVLYPPEEYQDVGESRVHYLNKVRDLYRKEYLVPLRTALDCPERRMSRNEWKFIDFSHVPSICMQNNFGHFLLHAPDEFTAYLNKVINGKASVSGATLQPHELVGRVSILHQEKQGRITKLMEKYKDSKMQALIRKVQIDMANAQWKTLVQSIKESTAEDNATLGRSIAICDMSQSMYWNSNSGTKPILSAMGLSLVLSNLAKPPFNGTIISFSDEPQVIKIDPESPFNEQVNILEHSTPAYSTNLTAVFLDLLLPIAQKHNLKKEDMVNRLFVFSDMEFNESGRANEFETLYELTKRKYNEAGYELPEIVWWNLSGQRPASVGTNIAPKPVAANVKGCSMLSGYSASMLKSFLEGEVDNAVEEVKVDEEREGQGDRKSNEEKVSMTAEEFMFKQLEHESFKDLVVID
ncbi:hypothetical protein EC973_008762 [Apophysomyces ossiformis]|uniref:Uncharacterized protein n=1 Tax=Apophysomyces ossiformis TaxID=679940 RepID=A0A8H7BT72_9FUNG|nr:hypothetical protein EC973_008762 [Apophysomyces ossiformis]